MREEWREGGEVDGKEMQRDESGEEGCAHGVSVDVYCLSGCWSINGAGEARV